MDSQWRIALYKKYILAALAVGSLALGLVGLATFLRPTDDGPREASPSVALADPSRQQAAAEAEYSAIRESIRQLDKKMDKLDLAVARLGQSLELVKNQREGKPKEAEYPPQFAPPPVPGGIGVGERKPMEMPADWLSGLDNETRARVDNVFKQNALRVREAMQGKGPIESMDKKALQEIFEGNQEILKSELKEVLPPGDYERFLSSLPQPPAPPEPTALPKRGQ